MNPTDLLEVLAEGIRETFESHDRESGFMPMLHLILTGDRPPIVIGMAMDGHPPDHIVPAMKACAGSPVEVACFVCDTYMHLGTKQPNWPRGSFARAFSEGDPDVSECLMAVAVDHRGMVDQIMAPYTWNADDRVYEWGDDPMRNTTGMAGYVVTKMIEGIAATWEGHDHAV